MVQSFWHSFVSYKKAPFLWWLWVSGIQQLTLMVTAWAEVTQREVTHLTSVRTCWLWSDAAGPEGRLVGAGSSLGVQAKCVNLERTQSIERNEYVHTHRGSCGLFPWFSHHQQMLISYQQGQMLISSSMVVSPPFLACACTRHTAWGQGDVVMLGAAAPPCSLLSTAAWPLPVPLGSPQHSCWPCGRALPLGLDFSCPKATASGPPVSYPVLD